MNALKSLIIASLICLPFTQVAWADDSTSFTPIAPPASDSTKVIAPGVTPIMPHTVVDQNNCVLSSKITAVLVWGSGGTKGAVTENCPVGYVASGMKAFVGVGISTGRYYWQTNCCKAYVTYTS